MGHYNYTVPEGIVGEVSSTVVGIRRTYVANGVIPFGSIVTRDPDAFGALSRVVKIQTTLELQRTIGVAVYEPTHPTSTYVQYDNMSVLTEGDIRVKIRAGNSFRAGDPVYIGYFIDTETVEFTPNPVAGDTVYGTFVDGGEATADNSFRIHFKPCNRRIPSS